MAKKTRRKLNKPVLAEGEITGHAHVLSPETDVYETETGTREFTIPEGDVLVHEEHGPVELPANEFASDRVLEIDPAAKDAKEKRVRD